MPDGANIGAPSAPIVALRRLLLRNGYRPVPIYPHDARVESAGKRPIGNGWRARAESATEADIATWAPGNTGILCGRLLGVDIDVPVPALAEQMDSLAERILGATPLRRIGRAPKLLRCYRVAELMAKVETPELFLPDGIKVQVEVLAQGQQFVAYGIHPDTGREYEWPDSGPDAVPLDDVPEVSADAVRAFVAEAEALLRRAGAKREGETDAPPPPPGAMQEPARPDHSARAGSDFFREVNRRALADCERWVRRLFPKARWQTNAAAPPGMWRIASSDLGRSYEEDLSIHPREGIHDFGPRKGMSPIDLVMEFGGAPDAIQAAHILCEWLGIAPADCGWREGTKRPGERTLSAPADVAEEPWPEPIDFLATDDLTGAPVLTADHLPAALWGFVADTAGRMGVDPAAVALGAVVAVASVCHDDWRVQPKKHDDTWTESPRIWGTIVGDPSILKSPVIAACTRPIDALEAKARERHAAAMEQHRRALSQWKKEGSDPATEPRAPRLDRYMCENSTTEALSEVLRDDASAGHRAPAGKVLVRADELSEFVANLDRYKGGGRGGGDRGAYLRLYNGGRFTIDRVGRGSFAVPNWSATFLGGIQPDPIQRVARDTADDGLLQRFCYCVPAAQGEGEDRKPNHEALARYAALFPILADLRAPSPQFGADRHVTLHRDAHPHREAINDLARAVAALPDTQTRLKAALGKWPALFARVALTFHLAELADAMAQGRDVPMQTILSEDTARRAAAYLRGVLLPHLLRADALMFRTPATGHARWIAGFILAGGRERIALRDVVQAYSPLRPGEMRGELQAVMEQLAVMGWLQPEPRRNPAQATAAWLVNPAVHTTFAARAAEERQRREKGRADLREKLARLQGA